MRIEREIVESLVKAGCRYIHIDAPGFTAYVDKPTMEQMKRARRGSDGEFLPLAQGRIQGR